MKKLSNLHSARIVVDTAAAALLHKEIPDLFQSPEAAVGLEYASTEHLWQSLKCATMSGVRRFTVTGDIGNPEKFGEVMRKMGGKDGSFWLKKKCIGVAAKMAVHPSRASSVMQLTLSVYRKTDEVMSSGTNDSRERRLWMEILRLKYEQNADLRAVLLATGSAPLVEFDRHGGYWGACRKKDSRLWVGQNTMGCYHMAIRSQLLPSK
jgi:hypothetical protein